VVPSSRVNESKKNFFTPEDGTDSFSRNVSDKPLFFTVKFHKRTDLIENFLRTSGRDEATLKTA